MEINWDSIKYIFQVPKDWYSYIHRKIHNAYGTLFIRVLDGEYGGMKIDIDRGLFKEAVDDAVDLDGYVKSVNNIEPDENGNVDLDENFLESSDITTPGIEVGTDYKGDQTVCSPNHKHNIKDVEGGIKTVNGNPPDEDGNVVVEVEDGVKTVNDIEPDEDGNVDLGQLVYTVNDHEPDEDGNISFDVVEKVDGVSPINGNVPLGAIRSIDTNIRPINGNVNLFDYYSVIGHEHQHTDITDWDTATDEFLEASDITTPGTVVGTDYAGEYSVCSPNHKHNAKDIVNSETDGFVTINTEQTITGSKTFKDSVEVEADDGNITLDANAGNITLANDSVRISMLGGNTIGTIQQDVSGLNLTNTSGVTKNCMLQLNPSGVFIEAEGQNKLIFLNTEQNSAQLANSPSTDGTAPDNAIATVGWVKEKALTVPDGKTPKTQDITLVSNVTWNGTQLVIQKQKLEFSNGVLTNVTNATSGTINTIAYSPT